MRELGTTTRHSDKIKTECASSEGSDDGDGLFRDGDRGDGGDATVADGCSGAGLGTGNDAKLTEWRDRLSRHSNRLRTEVFADFDVACVMTGFNDIKGATLPFLLRGDEVAFPREARERGGGGTP